MRPKQILTARDAKIFLKTQIVKLCAICSKQKSQTRYRVAEENENQYVFLDLNHKI
jgi:hypothetical protein